jgi:hypothetical protein
MERGKQPIRVLILGRFPELAALMHLPRMCIKTLIRQHSREVFRVFWKETLLPEAVLEIGWCLFSTPSSYSSVGNWPAFGSLTLELPVLVHVTDVCRRFVGYFR